MKIYRIERVDGSGLFRGPNNICAGVERLITGIAKSRNQDYFSIHPMPWDDSELVEQSYRKDIPLSSVSSRYGFSSKTQLKMWFPTKAVKQFIDSAGFMVSVYEVSREHFAKGDTQAVFHVDHAKLVDQLKITEI